MKYKYGRRKKSVQYNFVDNPPEPRSAFELEVFSPHNFTKFNFDSKAYPARDYHHEDVLDHLAFSPTGGTC
jgi:hypothetical protein